MASPPASALPPPRAHRAGTLALLARLAGLAGEGDGAALRRARQLVGPDAALPGPIAARDNALKYDAYLSGGPAGRAWGLTTNDRWEGPAFARRLVALVRGLPGAYALDVLGPRWAGLGARGAELTAGLGFDRPGAPPRVKLYLQERRWGDGVASAGAVVAAARSAAPRLALPAWVPAERAVGVVAVSLAPDGGAAFKLYLGAASLAALVEGAPDEVRALGAALAPTAHPAALGYHYLTLRLSPAGPPRYALNKVYNVQRAWADPAPAWAEVAAVFAAAGQGASSEALRAALASLEEVRCLPTALALEAAGRSADAYLAAWSIAGA